MSQSSISTTGTEYVRSLYVRAPFQKNRIIVLNRDAVCQYCQQKPSQHADHLIPAYDVDAAVGAGMFTIDQIIDVLNSVENLLGACDSCNTSKGSKTAGNKPDCWLPANPSTRAVAAMKNLGNWDEYGPRGSVFERLASPK